jgi:ketosteroid isomerase-like protein
MDFPNSSVEYRQFFQALKSGKFSSTQQGGPTDPPGDEIMVRNLQCRARRAFLGLAGAATMFVGCFYSAMATPSGTARSQLTHNVNVARTFFELLHRKDVDAWAELWAEDARIIVPYPPEGFGTSIDGKVNILSAFRGLFGNFESFDTEMTAVYPAADSDAVVVEYDVRATLVGGTKYSNSNIAVFRFESGKISAYHDYFDPRRFQAVIDALPKR